MSDLGRGFFQGVKDKAGEVGVRVRRLPGDDGADMPAEATAPKPGEPEHAETDQLVLADEPEEHASASDVRELVDLVRDLLQQHRPPSGPITQRWSLGVGDLLAAHPKVPKRLGRVARKLNRFGGVAVSPDQIEFDGDDVDWANVTAVRTRHVVDYLLGDAVQQQLLNLPVPWFPGRKRLLDALGQAILTIVIATARDQLESVGVDLQIPAELEYRGTMRRKRQLNASVLSAIVLADPAVNTCVVATAQARGIQVRAVGEERLANAEERAAAMKEKIAALEVELERFTRRFARTKGSDKDTLEVR